MSNLASEADIPQDYINSIHLQENCRFNENEIKSFVYYWFSLYDKHVDVNEFLPLIADVGLEMKYPFQDELIRSHEDFKKWYASLKIKSNTHEVERVDVRPIAGCKYKVDLVVFWQAEIEKENKEYEYTHLLVYQAWELDDGGGDQWPRILRCIVEEYRPTRQEIAEHAYQIFEQRGHQHGHDWDDWFRAEAELEAARHDASIAHKQRMEGGITMTQTLTEAVVQNDLIAVENLLKQEQDVNKKDAAGFTPLMIAAGLGNPLMVELLLKGGADVFITDSCMGATALHKAAQSGVVEVARLLVQRGAFIDAQAPTLGNTPLMDAVWHKHPAMVRYLLEQGARTELTNRSGAKPIRFAERDNNREIIGLLEEHHASRVKKIKDQRLMAAVQAHDVDEVKKLIAEGVEVDEKVPLVGVPFDDYKPVFDGYTPLLTAAFLGHDDIVQELLKAGANPRLVDDQIKATAGHKAGYHGNIKTARILVEDGRLELDAQGPYNGYTALHDAIWHGHTETAKVFIEAGARLDLRTHTGHTPLELAELYGYPEIAALIRKKMDEMAAKDLVRGQLDV